MARVVVRETPIEEAVKVSATIREFDKKYSKQYFEERYKGKEKLIIIGCIGNKPVGYLVGYDRYGDGSFYCWMAGVNPTYRKMGALKALMNYMIKWSKKKGYSKIKIKTRNNRREMLAYLVKYGFCFIGVEQKPDIKDNRIILEKGI